jgi:hypothetical protein
MVIESRCASGSAIEADSYRLKEAKELSAARTKQRRGKKH